VGRFLRQKGDQMGIDTQAAAHALQQLSSLHRRQRIINLACALIMLRTAVSLDNRQPVLQLVQGGAQ
jgi:hypothetical protein